MKKFIFCLLPLICGCSSLDVNIFGTSTKLTVYKIIISSDKANLSGSQLKEVAKDLNLKGGSFTAPIK